MKGGTTVIAFVQDPDGYKIELIERRDGVADARQCAQPSACAQQLVRGRARTRRRPAPFET